MAAPAVIAAPLVLAVSVSAASTPSPALDLSHNGPVKSKFAEPVNVTVSSVTPTWATVRFVLPAADQAAASETVVVYPANRWGAKPVFSGAVAGSPVIVTGLKTASSYYAEVSVNGAQGHAASRWSVTRQFTTPRGPAVPVPATSPASATSIPTPAPASATSIPTPAPTSPTATATATPATPAATTPAAMTPASAAAPDPAATQTTPGALPTFTTAPATWLPTFTTAPATSLPSPTSSATTSPGTTSGVPYAPALSAYATVSQSYTATDIISSGWAQDANTTEEGGGTCPVANTSYSPALDAVVMTTGGTPTAHGDSADCAHVRSQHTVPTSGDVVEAKIWLPSLTSATTFGGTAYPAGTLLDWASMWTDGANSTDGTENWPADTEVDAVETQYGANYISVHSGGINSSGGSTGDWTTEPQGWEPAGTIYGATSGGVPNVQGGWNVVDIEFTSTNANIYCNGALFTTIPASQLTHDPAYLDFGISGPSAYDSNNPSWPSGPATEDIQYVKVFS